MFALLAPVSLAVETTYTGAACPDGVFLVDGGKDTLPEQLLQPKSLWGTRCADGDADTGTARSDPFKLTSRSVVYLAGYPLEKDLGAFLINLATGEAVRLTPPQNPREAWSRVPLPKREEWDGQQVALEIRDSATGSGGWVGASAAGELPMKTRQESLMFSVAGSYALATLIFALPLIACFFVFRRVGASTPHAGLHTVACSGVLAYLAFWLGVAFPGAFPSLAIAFPVIAVVALMSLDFIGPPPDPASARSIRPMLLVIGFVWAIGLVFLACGHLYGPAYWPAVNGNVFEGYFFEQSRPPDDMIPLNFAREILNPNRDLSAPDVDGWHFSDRGPLQTGYVLLATPVANLFGWYAAYQAVGTLLQIVACASLWVFARAIGVGQRTSFLILAAIIATPLVYFNALYVWPKMLAGGLCLLSLAILFPPLIRREKLSLGLGVCAAVLASLSILAHGATIFAFVAAGLLMLPGLHRVYGFGTIGAMLVAAAALMGSWTAYGAFIDPGEDKLTRLHFTGGVDDPGLSIGQRIIQSHTNRKPDAWAMDRLSNLSTLFGELRVDGQIISALGSVGADKPAPIQPLANPAIDTSRLANASGFERLVTLLRVDQREFVFRSFAFAGLGLILIFVAWTSRKPETADLRRALRLSVWFMLITTLIWSIAEFYGGRTVVTHASFGYLYVIAVAALVSASLTFRPLVVIALIANIAVLLAVWILPGPGVHLRSVFTQAGLDISLQNEALIVLAPALVAALACGALALLHRDHVPDLQPIETQA